ncbi:MAG TPA: 16S rRNA (cytidine(1402)-2'-O)-methyltransferase [Spirochaetota bacterium]|nr:16S rRNA (cytidine(1402)-2'-O)-methyltransferase [Spirochaetota bacterium]HNT11997.1 16S rRNA (cytidine(1402)-2'-O)-methyltransferase [Spirochaetota bacterium]
MPGTLYIIGGPIGNLEDITLRALRILRECTDVIYCEDTRQTHKLAAHYGIGAPLVSLHAHSSDAKLKKAVDDIAAGRNAAYLTDSGTPGLSDPGARFVAAARAAGVAVVPVPGPSALTALVSVAGLGGRRVLFAGFLSTKDGRRRRELERFRDIDGAIVVYESPYRIKKLLRDIATVLPGARIAIGREMTKTYEEIITGSIEEIIAGIDSLTDRGEFAVAIAPCGDGVISEDE